MSAQRLELSLYISHGVHVVYDCFNPDLKVQGGGAWKERSTLGYAWLRRPT